jgi:lipoprotein-releasing system ATP-binding protein
MNQEGYSVIIEKFKDCQLIVQNEGAKIMKQYTTFDRMHIVINHLEKSYGPLQVLKGINLQVEKGEVVSIVGASGAGKTTLLHILGTLDKADKGTVSIGGIETGKLNGKSLAAFRNKHIGFVFQFHQLLPEFTAIENVILPALIGGTSKKEALIKAAGLLKLLGVSDKAEQKPSTLSGGEQQRVAVARALINNPDLILADEPSGNLDSVNAKDLHELFFRLRKELNQTFVIVTHNEELANMADRKLVMKDGRMV